MGDPKNCTILVIAALLVIGGIVTIGIYFATYVKPDHGPATTDPSIIDPTTYDPDVTHPMTSEAGNLESTTNESEATTTIEPTDPQITLLFGSTIDGRILMLDPKQKNYTTIVDEENHFVKSFDYYGEKNVFFYATEESNESIKLSSEEYENSMNSSARWTKTAMAFDYISEKMYLLDGLAGKLYVMDVDNDGYAVVLTDLDKPKDILVDSERRLMFILQETSILSVHLDGRKMLEITKGDEIRAFAIDRKNGKIYYANNDDVSSIDYLNNKPSKSIVKIENLILSMAVLADQLMLISTSKNCTERSLNYCLFSEKCTSTYKVKINDGQVSLIFQIKSYDIVKNDFVNPCQEENGGCEQLCISSVNDRNYTCKCNAGWQLNDDLKSCSTVKDFIMYIHDNKIKGRTLDMTDNSFVDMDLDYKIADPPDKQMVNFDYDSHSNLLVYAIGSNIHYKNLTDKTEWMIKDDSQCDIIPMVDWVSKNLYNLKNCPEKSYLTVRNLCRNSKDEKQLFEYEGNIKSIVIIPDMGKIFFTYHDILDNKTWLHSLNLNGKELTKLKYKTYEMGVTVDFNNKLIFYMYMFPTQIFGLNFTLTDIDDVVSIKLINKPKWISAFQGYLYIANVTEIWRIKTHQRQEIQQEFVMKVKKDDIQGFRIYSKKVQPIDMLQPCAFENDGCQRYCFAVRPAKDGQLECRCDCNDNEVLGEDQRTCSERIIPKTVIFY